MNRNILIVHYNTPELTSATVNSIRKHSPGCNIYIFDNSDEKPFPNIDNVHIIDNTKGQLINFDDLLDRYPNKVKTCNNHASSKHIASVDYAFKYIPDGFMLLDSDILIKRDIRPLFDDRYSCVGTVQEHPEYWFQSTRLYPFLLYINVPLLNKHGISFWHEGMSYKLSHAGHPPYYDTGGSLYHDCIDNNLPIKYIDIFEYIEHFGGGSYDKRRSYKSWLNKFKSLYSMEDKKNGERILVVIPYCSEGSQGRELEYSVEGWRRHFKDNYLIVLVGEDHPVTKTGDDIICIESERVEGKEGMYRQHLDYVSCFRKVHERFPDSKGFIFTADDVYAVNDFDMSDVMSLKYISDNMDSFSHASNNGWKRDKARTRDLLKSEGYPTKNFTTHLPMFFEWDKIEALWDKYDMDNNSYVIEDLYFNIYYPSRIPLHLNIDYDNVKCGVYRQNPRIEYIKRAFSNKIWIQNSVEGWIPELDKMLSDYYAI